jgi:hypothetical protein
MYAHTIPVSGPSVESTGIEQDVKAMHILLLEADRRINGFRNAPAGRCTKPQAETRIGGIGYDIVAMTEPHLQV